MAPRSVRRQDLTCQDLQSAAKAALGGGRRLDSAERVSGGTTKGVYRLTMDDGTTAIAYSWSDSENYWPTSGRGEARIEPFTPGVGLELYESAHAKLSSLGLRVPEIYLIDRDRLHFPADLAIIEDIPGPNLEKLSGQDPHAAAPTMERFAEALAALRGQASPTHGKVRDVEAGGKPTSVAPVDAVMELSRRNLAEAAAREPRIAEARDRLEQRLTDLAAAVGPRPEYTLVHGELGLDHVLVDSKGNPVIIDIEALMYFDVEWEHTFLQIRMGDSYPLVEVDGLDPIRSELYMLARRLWLVAGPLRLLDGDFPDRAFMLQIVEWNINAALEFARD